MSKGYEQFHNEQETANLHPPVNYPGPPVNYPGPQDPQYQPCPNPPGYAYQQPVGINSHGVEVVVAPQPQTIITTTAMMPEDFFGLALFVTLCCCLPLGIAGLVKASEVRNRFAVGDIAGAQQASEDARRYSYWGLWIGIGMIVISVILCAIVVGVTVAAANAH